MEISNHKGFIAIRYKNAKGQDRDWKLFDRVKAALRNLSYKTPIRQIVLKRARTERGKYKCELCGAIKKTSEIVVDHIEPIVPVTGFDNWDGLIERLFCLPEGLQVICKKPCHAEKSKKENSLRREHEKVDKKPKKL